MIVRLRRFLIFCLILDLCILGYILYHEMETSVPDRIFAFRGKTGSVSLPDYMDIEESQETLNVTNKESGFTFLSQETGEYEVPVRLFGILPVKNVAVNVIDDMKAAPSGEPIGIYVETSGLLVLDTAEIEGKDGLTYAPGNNIVKTGDYILEWNHEPVATIGALNRAIQTSGKKKAAVTIRRGKEKIEVSIRPILATDRTYKIGVWVREDTQGIGTLTYVTENGVFGTLGHGITDADTGSLLNLQGGELYRTKILGITKGTSGEPGELQGYINMVAGNMIGEITRNTNLGVFGQIDKDCIQDYCENFLPIGMKQDIRCGKALLLADLDGTRRKYEIEIEEININSRDNKSMIIRITDSRLLRLTGGIVQGMSGSPIIQDGKLIGAVTHVLVNDPTRGYGIFIENMLEH